jgi:alginate O-acetyltransferase complex protein AlgI
MAFDSSLFLFYFLPAFLVVYILLPRKLKNWFLLLSSILLYGWSAPVFVFLLGGSVLVDYFLIRGLMVDAPAGRKVFLWFSVVMNLGLLLIFKYLNFFADQFQDILGWFGIQSTEWQKILLPAGVSLSAFQKLAIGISFITFQKLACILDVYKRHHPGFRRLQDYALYIFMFPQILSGPIVRPGQILGQIEDRRAQENSYYRLTGFYRFMIGLSKKLLIADILAVTVNQIFSLGYYELSTGLAWVGAIAYTFQVYFDFSGYTDMAIGMARMIGFRLPENFNNPYISGSITEFWKRWHMTLSLWFRDYVFLPLAYIVSRKLPKEHYLGLRADKVIYLLAASVTFLLCGFWHAAAWTFILWGAYQGIFLVFDRLFLLRFFRKTGRVPAIIFTFFVLLIGWVLFRSESIHSFGFYLGRMFAFRPAENTVWLNPKFWGILCIAIVFSFMRINKNVEAWQERFFNSPANKTVVIMTLAALCLLILNAATLTLSGYNPFIYFRF